MDFSSFWASIWDPIKTPLATAAGIVGSQLWKRYLNRMAVFRWSASHQPVATSSVSRTFGRIEVSWNGDQVRAIQLCEIELENESSRDFSNVEVKFAYADGTKFLGEGSQRGTNQILPFTARYQTELARLQAIPAADRDQDEIDRFLALREYVIPVFNRGSRIVFTFAVLHVSDQTPQVTVGCDHLGVRLVHRPERPMTFGVVQLHAVWVGLAVAVLASVAVYAMTANTAIVATAAFILAAFGQLIGAGVIHLKRRIVRAIG